MISGPAKIWCLFVTVVLLAAAGCDKKENDNPNPANFIVTCDSAQLAANDTNTSSIRLTIMEGYTGNLELTTTNGVLLYKGRPAQRHLLNTSDFKDTTIAKGILQIRANRIPDNNVLLILKSPEGIVASTIIKFYKRTYDTVVVSKRPLFINGALGISIDSLQSTTEPYVELTLAVDTLLRDSLVTFTTSNNASFNPTGTAQLLSQQQIIPVNGICKIKLYVYNPQSTGSATVSVYLANAPAYRFDTTVSLYSLTRLLGLNSPLVTVTGNPVVANGINFATIEFKTIEALAGQQVSFIASDGKFLFSGTSTYLPNLDNVGAANAYFLPDSGTTGISVIQIKYYNNIYQTSTTVTKTQ